MLLSIILPFFNPMPFFIRMIESLILEAKPFCDISLVEIIFINDGSTDHAVSFIKKYESYKNIHIFSIINSGVSNARNVGLNLCNGEYVWFVDADDLIPHMSIDVIIRKLQSLTKPTDIIFAYG